MREILRWALRALSAPIWFPVCLVIALVATLLISVTALVLFTVGFDDDLEETRTLLRFIWWDVWRGLIR